jgi:hypothetical protein
MPAPGQIKRSDPNDVSGLRTLGAFDDFELDVLSLFERPETRALDCRVVHEDVAAALALDEPVPLGVVEPLDLACDALFLLPGLLVALLPELLFSAHRLMNRCFDTKKKAALAAFLGSRRAGPQRDDTGATIQVSIVTMRADQIFTVSRLIR